MPVGECIPHHDWFNALLTFGLCLGLVISYLPQHYRIIHAKSSEGFSPIFLLLGTTSAASGMFNMITLQTPIVRCCRVVSYLSCVEMFAGIIQVGLQWLCFTLVFVLYMIYYPEHRKYESGAGERGSLLPRPSSKDRIKSVEWRLSVIAAWIVGFHFFFTTITTVYLLLTIPSSPDNSLPRKVSAWATFLGVTAAILAAIQYAPQLLHTYRSRLVGALSIPMMMIQTPGGFLMVTSIVLRPGTNWTSWATFLVAALLQGCLLIMCITWKVRQHKLGIDDFGNSLHGAGLPSSSWSEPYPAEPEGDPVTGSAATGTSATIRVALVRAVEPTVETDLHTSITDQTPLLAQRPGDQLKKESIWSKWFGKRSD